MEPILIALLGYLLGAAFRTSYDYLWKAMEDPDFSWDHKYSTSFIISVILSVMTAMVTFPTIQPPVDGITWIFISSVTIGFTMNHLVNKPISYLSEKAAA